MSKKDIVKSIIEEYEVTSPTYITHALKDLLGETLQEMMNAEFDQHMGYKKHDQSVEKSNYRNGSSKKAVKTSQGTIDVSISRDRNASFDPIVIENIKEIFQMLIIKLLTFMQEACQHAI